MSIVGNCEFCKMQAKLSKSHAIPNAFFKKILQQSKGSYIDISTDKRLIHKSGDSGKDRMLCVSCKASFNENYDKLGINSVMKWRLQLSVRPIIRRVKCDHEIIASFIVSIIWRASRSRSEIYEQFKLPKDIERIVEECLRRKFEPLDILSFRVMNLCDPSGGFSAESLSDFLAGPYFAKGQRKNKLVYAVIIIFSGLVFYVFFPKTNAKIRSLPGFLRRSGVDLFIHDISIFNVPMMGYLMEEAFRKNEAGLKTF